MMVLPIVLPVLAALIAGIEKGAPRIRVAVPATVLSSLGQVVFAVAGAMMLFGADGTVAGTGSVTTLNAVRAVVGEYPAGVGITLVLDGIGLVVGAVISLVGLAVVLYAAADREHYDATFFVLTNLLLAGMHCVILTDDLFNMFVFLEIVGIAAYLLIVHGRKGHAVLASFRYLMVSSLAMAIFLIGVFVIYRETGTFGMRAGWALAPDGAVARIGVAALVVGVGLRAAFFPLHGWLPDAHAYAPHAVSALLSGLMIKVSLVALIRVLNYTSIPSANLLKLWVGVITAVVGVVMALSQCDVKRLLAYSSVSQMGYLVAAAGAAGIIAQSGGRLYYPGAAASVYGHLITHAVSKATLFLVIGVIVDAYRRRSIAQLGGVGGRHPWLFAVFVVAALVIVGVPPTGGYATKKLIEGAVKSVWPLGGTVLTAVGVLTAAAMIKLSSVFWRAPQGLTGNLSPAIRRPFLALGLSIPVALMAVLAVAQRPFEAVLGRAVGVPHTPKNAYEPSSLLTTAGVLFLAYVVYRLVSGRYGEAVAARVRRGGVGLQGLLYLTIGVFAVLAAATPVIERLL